MARIKLLTVKGFRAFGARQREIEFSPVINIIFAPNSQGKTSLAEAIEFLLTGKTVRRELVASAKHEFAEALRNAHLPRDEEVVVAAQIEDDKGHVYQIERHLVRDYTGNKPCESKLMVDGKPSEDLTRLGIRLSRPPLEAPVLMPHTLRYVVSAEPQKRTDYFKALLEVSDLEEIRDAIIQARKELPEPDNEVLRAYELCRSNPQFGSGLASLETAQLPPKTVENLLSEALGRILAGDGKIPSDLDGRLSAAKERLQQQRAQTFPVDDLVPRKGPSWGTRPDVKRPLEAFLSAKSSVDKKVSRLLRLFEEILRIPGIAKAEEAVDCPVCETPRALTPERIAAIRQKVEANTRFTACRQQAESVLRDLSAIAQKVVDEAKAACPSALSWREQERSRYEAAMAELLGASAANLMPTWRETLSHLAAALESLKEKATAIGNTVKSLQLDDLDKTKLDKLCAKATALFQSTEHFSNALGRYRKAVEPLVAVLKQEIDRRAGTEGWQELIDLCENREVLLRSLRERAACRAVQNEVEEAIREIDRAKAEVLDDKFAELGEEILRWWNLLRPEEPTSFHGLGRRGTGTRYIDLKARLSNPHAPTSEGVLRDAVAVFSDSQLNCLGLAAFLARTIREGAGFVVLDDPVPASDREHRAYFVDKVLSELVEEGIQVIVLTHDDSLSVDIQERYKHLKLAAFHILMKNPVEGSNIKVKYDTLDAKLERAKCLISKGDHESCKSAARELRDAAERFCKLVLIEHRRRKGERFVNVSAYEGWDLGKLTSEIRPILDKDASHPGKLDTIRRRLNPGSHDDKVPSLSELRQCLGDLRTLCQAYLD